MRQTLTLAIDALAVARITRIVTKDYVTHEARDAVIEDAYGKRPAWADPKQAWTDVVAADDDPPMKAYFVTCPWCVSVYVAIGVVAARRLAPRLWDPVAHALAFSHLAGLGANIDVDV